MHTVFITQLFIYFDVERKRKQSIASISQLPRLALKILDFISAPPAIWVILGETNDSLIIHL